MPSAAGRGRARPAERIVTGLPEIDRKLQRLKVGAANRIARPGLVKSVRVVAQGIKSACPSDQKDVKRAIGGSVKRPQGKGQVHAKAGAAVGSASKAQAKPKRRGVGIGARNIMWWILGTKDRIQKKTSRATGKMPPEGIVKRGYEASAGKAKSALIEGCRAGFAKEAAKK